MTMQNVDDVSVRSLLTTHLLVRDLTHFNNLDVTPATGPMGSDNALSRMWVGGDM